MRLHSQGKLGRDPNVVTRTAYLRTMYAERHRL